VAIGADEINSILRHGAAPLRLWRPSSGRHPRHIQTDLLPARGTVCRVAGSGIVPGRPPA
jgi:hypothetical protein